MGSSYFWDILRTANSPSYRVALSINQIAQYEMASLRNGQVSIGLNQKAGLDERFGQPLKL